jgi:hypothetical protein
LISSVALFHREEGAQCACAGANRLGLIHRLFQTLVHDACITQPQHDSLRASSAGFEKRAGGGWRSESSARLERPCLGVDGQRHLAFQHQACFFAIMRASSSCRCCRRVPDVLKQVELVFRRRGSALF